ncbi:MAG: hypothetical protein JNJ46_13735 [Myxococcales bacterium]|nr:hypothetical protein [Myxococcales bacterium]
MPKRPAPPSSSASRHASRGPASRPASASSTEPAKAITPLYASGGEWLAQSPDPQQVLDHLLERPDAARLVRSAPVQPLYLFVRALGLADALDVLSLCSTEQVQAFLDMDGWERDRLDPARVLPWLLALAELGPSKLSVVAEGLDPELWTTLLGPCIRVYDIYKNEEPPDQPEGVFFDTPDRMFRVDILPPSAALPDEDKEPALAAGPASEPSAGDPSDAIGQIQRLLDALYRGNAELARAIVQSAGYDVGPETAENAYRFRSARMADLGYIEYYEALKVYLLLDPHKPAPPSELEPLAAALRASPPAAVHVLPGSDTVSGALLRTVPGLGEDDSTFARAVAHLSEPERALLVQHLMVLGNRVLSADRVELGDVDALRLTLRRTVGYISLGLELRLLPASKMGQGAASGPTVAESPAAAENESLAVDIRRAADVLREVSLLHLFRVGYSLTVQPRKLALLLLASSDGILTRPAATPTDASRVSTPAEVLALTLRVQSLPARWAQPLAALLAVRPLYSLWLDGDPPEPTSTATRPFASLRDLGRATALLGELSSLSQLLSTGLGLRRDHVVETLGKTCPGRDAVLLVDLVGTLLGNLLLMRPPALVPLSRRDLVPLRAALVDEAAVLGPAQPRPAVVAQIVDSLRERIYSRSFGEAEFATLWTPATQRLLRDTLSTLAKSLGELSPDLSPELADALPRLVGLLLPS